MRRILAPVVAVLAVAGCLGEVSDPSVPIPSGSTIYMIEPSLLQYRFTDSSGGRDVHLRWLASFGFTGRNCIALLPTSPTDTTGTFVFRFFGSNTGALEETVGTTIDTIQGFFFPPRGSDQGTHGTYATDSNNRLLLQWADGLQSRYFQPAADIRIMNDTITSNVDSKFQGDSIREEWHVPWILTDAC